MSTAQDRPPAGAAHDDDEPARTVAYRTDDPAATLNLPVTVRIERMPDGQGFTAALADRTISAPSLWDLCRALYCEFEDAADNRATAAALADAAEHGAIPWDQVKAELEL